MKKEDKGLALQYYSIMILFLILPFVMLIAQSDVKINSNDIGSWFQRNWIGVAGAALIPLTIALFGKTGSKRKITTIVKDDHGNVKV